MSRRRTSTSTGSSEARDQKLSYRMLATRIKNEHDGTAMRLKSALKALEVNVQRALRALEDGEGLDAHLIVNASSITEEIARWNLARDLMPLVQEEDA